MQNDLKQIQPFIQAYVNAIGAILKAGVTVVDCNLTRIAGTQDYQGRLGEKISEASFFKKVIKSGKPAILKNAKGGFECENCERKSQCSELADLAYPIFYKKQIAGVIGIAAFCEEQRDKLLDHRGALEEFLKYMSMLIESKLSAHNHSQELENQLSEAISNSRRELEETGFIGHNPKVRALLELTAKVADSDSTVLITGESGTGKEVLAKLLHSQSPRRGRLMVSINCAAIPEQLVESELFGYVGGAFTGARKEGQAGKFEAAHESTLFLDEIGEMPLTVQTKLLRVLQERKVQRVGGRAATPVDVRIICATNQDLMTLVEKKLFRLDLYYRLNVIPMHIPPLRERLDDLPLFIDEFIGKYNRKLKKNLRGVTPAALAAFNAYHWPGNVRELKNIIEYFVNVAEEGQIDVNDLPGSFTAPQAQLTDIDLGGLKKQLAWQEKQILAKALKLTSGDKKEAANKLDISLATFYRKLSEHGL